jgi:Domain of unknown function (DUF4160)
MPTVFRSGGFRFFFYSNEARPREPVHVHVERGDSEAKFWIRPEIAAACNDGYDARSLRLLVGGIEANRDRIEKAWNDFFR